MNRNVILLLLAVVAAGVVICWGTQWQPLNAVAGNSWLRNRWTGELLSCAVYPNPDDPPPDLVNHPQDRPDYSQVHYGYHCMVVPPPKSKPKPKPAPSPAATTAMGSGSINDQAVKALLALPDVAPASAASGGAH